jgi:hypothetical protein
MPTRVGVEGQDLADVCRAAAAHYDVLDDDGPGSCGWQVPDERADRCACFGGRRASRFSDLTCHT